MISNFHGVYSIYHKNKNRLRENFSVKVGKSSSWESGVEDRAVALQREVTLFLSGEDVKKSSAWVEQRQQALRAPGIDQEGLQR